jgi:hypothetical protein
MVCSPNDCPRSCQTFANLLWPSLAYRLLVIVHLVHVRSVLKNYLNKDLLCQESVIVLMHSIKNIVLHIVRKVSGATVC